MSDIDRRDDVLSTADTTDIDVLPDEGALAGAADADGPLSHLGDAVRAEEIPEDIAALAASEVDDPGEGFFGPDSLAWRINRENVLYVAGVTPILLQIAHPSVAAGLRDHSTLQSDYRTRLTHTFDIVDTLFFGDVESAITGAVIVRRLHEGVAGRVDDSGVDDGTYYANDPELLWWVAATLFDLSTRAYETLVEPLSRAEKRRYYREHTIFQRLMGLPEAALPDTLGAFEERYASTIDDDLVLGETGRAVTAGFLDQFGRARPVAEFLGAAWLPASARELFGFEWGPSRQRRFDAVGRLFRSMPLWALPDRVRYRKQYRAFDRV
ncbi:Uncharacterized conserved protein, DUF2236 family [Natronoarchaeum philippinense]|uniref:Uncharacterized conserved protein, DUF2236 family n=1 Tax=Natronoarchaeum philippinense TaxID=558529 RepID=A0A285P4J7_NATPI|nr:oxygenase MpaB family protein [Natronoarchaeum philippinense]SNZ15086.1 Uncharacterized conserved protein, DUF2236 family [Natronoarchaeum philippinense]